MALSVQSIFDPLNDYFVEHFRTQTGSAVMFRLDQFGLELGDDDFSIGGQPGAGYSPAMAVETFSDIVNRVPHEAGDGLNVINTTDAIDSTYYYRFVTPAVPTADASLSAADRQTLIDTFSLVKADALRTWESAELASISGLRLNFKPSLATPETWYDSTKTDAWTHHSLVITDTTTPGGAPAAPDTQLWKLKASDAVMTRALQLPDPAPAASPAPPMNLATRALQLRMASPAASAIASPARIAPSAPAVRMSTNVAGRFGGAAPQVDRAAELRVVSADPGSVAAPAALSTSSVAIFDNYLAHRKTLPIAERIEVAQYVGAITPTQPAEAEKVTVTFDYCLVQIRRPWYTPAFVNNASWYVPGTPKGAMTVTGTAGSMSFLPIALVGIRNLSIEANWSATDVRNASIATGFGPFKINSNVVNSTLAHAGLQVIGWLLQAMPQLPPNDPPVSGGAVP